jgi:hypothetical protein
MFHAERVVDLHSSLVSSADPIWYFEDVNHSRVSSDIPILEFYALRKQMFGDTIFKMPRTWTPKVALGRESLDEEKEHGSQDNLLPMSSADEIRDDWKPERRPATKWRWTILNVILFIFSLSVLLHRIYELHVQASDRNYLLKQTSYFCKSLNLASFYNSI